MPSFGGTRRRHHGKQPSQSKKTSPPAPLSITSNGPSELSPSSSTPRNVFHSSLRPSKRAGLTAANLAERPASGYGQAKSTEVTDKENVDVFAFMECEDRDDSSTETSDDPTSETSPPSSPNSVSDTPRMIEMPQKSPRYSDLEVRVQNIAPRAWRQDSLHSDSGISVRSHSPDEQDSPIMTGKLRLNHETPRVGVTDCELDDDPASHGLQISPNLETDNASFGHQRWPSLNIGGPEACRVSSPRMLTQHAHVVDEEDRIPEMQARSASSLAQLEMRRRRGSRSGASIPPEKSGYDLLASNIDSRNDAFLTPIYRKFEILNNRMLLYLQDEIAQMEEDLKELDAAIALEDADLGRRGSASRRSEAKLPSQLQWHRMDLMGRTFAKVEQYNRALASYSNLTKSLEPASHADVMTYRQWITQHTPIAEQEARFLDKQSDLLSVTPQQASTASNAVSEAKNKQLETPIVVVAFALVSTIIVFKIVPRILARLLISAMVGLAALAILYPGALTSLKSARELGRGIAMYSSVMLVLSIIVG